MEEKSMLTPQQLVLHPMYQILKSMTRKGKYTCMLKKYIR